MGLFLQVLQLDFQILLLPVSHLTVKEKIFNLNVPQSVLVCKVGTITACTSDCFEEGGLEKSQVHRKPSVSVN